ncbi:MAG: PD-(D/E)XK nuclease family protein [bacterium]|nr:MAG: PD-(D/E)XK nuclease family protein [bacterium]
MSGRLELHYSPDLTHLVNHFLEKNLRFTRADGGTYYLTTHTWRIPPLKRQWTLQNSLSYAVDYPFKSMYSFLTLLYEKMNIPLQRALFSDQCLMLHEIIIHLRDDLQYFYSSEHPPTPQVIRELTAFFNIIRLEDADREIIKSATQRLALSTSDKLLQNLAIIFTEYLRVLEGDYLDEAGLLKEITGILDQDFLNQHFPVLQTIIYEDISFLKKRHLDLFETFRKLGVDVYFLMAYGKNKEIFAPKDLLFNKIRHTADHVEGYLNIRKLSDSLFQIHHPQFPFSDKIEILPAGSRLDEIEKIAAIIKTAVNSGECKCTEIAVCSPQLEIYKPYLDIYFTRYGIPYTHDGAIPLHQTLPVKNLLLLLETVQENYPVSLLESVMASHSLRYKGMISNPSLPGMLSTFRVKQGRKEILRYVKKEQLLEDSEEREKKTSRPYQEIALILKQIFDDLRFFEKKHPPYFWFENILSLIENHKMTQKITVEAEISAFTFSQVNLAALDQLIESLQQWKKFSMMIRGDIAIDLQEFLEIFRFIIQSTSVNIRMPARVGVQIVALDELMKNNFKQIFIIGMEDDAFPGKVKNSFSPPQYLLPHLISFIDQEHFLRDREQFYQIVQNQAARLYFSYPRYHQEKPLLPSIFLRELERLSDAPLEKQEKLHLYSPADVIDQLPIERDKDGTTKIDFEQIPADLRPFISVDDVKQLNLKMKVIASRQTTKDLSAWEGNLTSFPPVSAYLQRRFETVHFSPTQLEMYAYCPMIFFFERVLDIRKAEEREAYLSPLDRGVLIHDTLFRFYTELNPENRNLPGLIKIADEELSKLSVTANLLWELDKGHFLGNEDMKGVLPAYLEYEEKISSFYTTHPAHFELSFGRPLKSGETHDTLSTETPFLYQVKNEKFFFSGKVDRVEIGPDGVLLIVDYKTGVLPGLREMWDGQRLQLPIYLMAVYHQLIQKYPELKMGGGAFYALGRENEIEKRVIFMDKEYNFVDQDLSKYAGLPNQKYLIENSPATLQDFINLVLDHAVSYIREIRKGNFVHTADSSRCRSRNGKMCDYFPVCRVNALKQAHLKNYSDHNPS